MLIRIVIYVIAALLIGAHFLRAANLPMVAICLSLPLMFFWRSRLSLVVLQVCAYAAAGVWLHTAWELVHTRLAHNQDWKLGAAILGTVASFSVLAGVLLNAPVMRQRNVE